MNLFPTTYLGKWSAWLLAAFVLMFIIMNIFVALGQTGGNTIFDNLYLSIPAIIGGLCAICAFFTGIISIYSQKERALVVFVSTAIGLLLLVFLLGEFFVPH